MPWNKSLYYIKKIDRQVDPLQVKVKQHGVVKHLPGIQMMYRTRLNDYSMSNGQMNSPFDKCFALGIEGFNFFHFPKTVFYIRDGNCRVNGPTINHATVHQLYIKTISILLS